MGTVVEQRFDCLIIQNRQAVHSVGRSMDWTLEDNMVDGLFFCATLTGRRGGHTPFVEVGVERSDTSAEAVKPDPRYSWKGRSRRMGVGVGDGSAGCTLVGLYLSNTTHYNGDPLSGPPVYYYCQLKLLVVVRRGQMGVSI